MAVEDRNCFIGKTIDNQLYTILQKMVEKGYAEDIPSRECFNELTLDSQLYLVYAALKRELWTPTPIPTIFWYDAADLATITATGSEVTQVLDKSGNSYTLTRASGTVGPNTGTRTLNGLNVFEWTGNNCLENTAFTYNQAIKVSDSDYASGETGFFVQTLDVTEIHIHFDALVIQKVKAPQPSTSTLFQDDFTNPASGWPEEKFDNYFIGYHEPEYYRVEITSPTYKTTVFEPEKKSFGDASMATKVFTNSKKTSETGDFNYGIAFRRSGDQYYVFTISPRTKQWHVLKSSSTSLTVLAEGTEAGINDLDVEDALRVDVQGSSFSFYINEKPLVRSPTRIMSAAIRVCSSRASMHEHPHSL